MYATNKACTQQISDGLGISQNNICISSLVNELGPETNAVTNGPTPVHKLVCLERLAAI